MFFPQIRLKKTISKRTFNFIFTSLILLWISAAANLLFFDCTFVLYPLFQKSFSLVCHQDTAKSIIINNLQMLICSRCTGIYSGAFFASVVSIFFFLRTDSKNLFFAAMIPLLADVILYNAGVYQYSFEISFITGFIFGSILFLYILEPIENYIYGIKQ